MKTYFSRVQTHLTSNSKIAIIGAGIAGCALSYKLSQKLDNHIDIYDRNSAIANEASGNLSGIMKPYITSDENLAEQFYNKGFYKLNDFVEKNSQGIKYKNCGIVQLFYNEKEQQRYTKIFQKRQVNKNFVEIVDKTILEKISNIYLPYGGMYFSQAKTINPKSLCAKWLNLSQCNLYLDYKLINISKEDKCWKLEFIQNNKKIFKDYQIVIFAGGYDLFKQINFLQDLAVYPAQGQVTIIDNGLDLQTGLIDKCYILPTMDNKQVIGATYRNNDDICGDIRQDDDMDNLIKLKNILDTNNRKIDTLQIIESRVSTRCVTIDHLPMIGHLADINSYKDQYKKLVQKGTINRHLPTPKYLDGLYLASSFGSKGLDSSLLSAEIITNLITNTELCISDRVYQAIHPLRFSVRDMKKARRI